MSVSLNDLLRLQREQARAPSTSTSMSLTYRPDTPPPEVFRQQADPSDYQPTHLRAQDVDPYSPRSTAGAMETLGGLVGDAYQQYLAPTVDDLFSRTSARVKSAIYGEPDQPTLLGRALTAAEPHARSLAESFASGGSEALGVPGGVGLGLAGAVKVAGRERALPPLTPQVKRAIENIVGRTQAQAGHKMSLPAVNVSELERFYAEGRHDPEWYLGTPERYQEMYGKYADLVRGFNAATSMRLQPSLQLDRSNRALRLYMEGGPKAIRKVPGLGQPNREMEAMANLWEQDPRASMANVFNPKGSPRGEFPAKRTDYYDVMGGEHKPVVDTWIGRVGYGEHPTKVWEKTGEPMSLWEGSGGRKQFLMYERLSDVITELAKFREVSPETYQGRVWTPLRRAFGYMQGNDAFADQMVERGRMSPDYQWLVKRGVLNGIPENGRRHLAITFALMAGAGAGAAATGASEARE